MELFWIIVLLIVGLVLIIKGGDWFVDASSWIAEISGIPHFIIGATIVSVATTLPELLVSAIAASKGKVDMAVGNAVGSVNANIALIMAISLIFMPHTFERSNYMKKGILMVSSVLVLYLLCLNGQLDMGWSFILLAIFVLFIIENIFSLKKKDSVETPEIEKSKSTPPDCVQEKRPKPDGKTITKNVLLFIFGAAGIIGGAQLLVDNGCKLAEIIGIPESIIAVTLVAVGTSLPELITTVSAIIKKKSEISIGNIIGANIIDITLILPICSMITGGSLPVAYQSVALDLPFCLAFSGIAIIPALFLKKFTRWQGILLLLGYVAYMVILSVLF